MRSEISLYFNKNEIQKFDAWCNIAIRNVGNGSRKATEAACKEIMENSKAQVPKDTETLLESAFYEVRGRTDVASTSYVFEAILGYGGNGNPRNPITGKLASYYMLMVHEDLTVFHMNGKAKFLEDPVREYAANNFKQTVFKYAKESLASMSD